MSKYHGVIGYGESVEQAPGVWEDVITTRTYYGDVLQNTRRLSDGNKVSDDIFVSNSISIVADAYAYENFFAMRYISWMGAKWVVASVDVARPRLIIRLGGVYNGPTG